MAVSLDDVKKLKDLTGVGLTDAKAALEEAKGNFDEALEQMRQKGLTKVAKRAGREARAGLIGTYNHDSRIGVVVEVNCETDFVARNDKFADLVKDLTLQIAATAPKYVSRDELPKGEAGDEDQIKALCLLEQPYIKDQTKTVSDHIKATAAVVGENIVVRRFSRLELGETA